MTRHRSSFAAAVTFTAFLVSLAGSGAAAQGGDRTVRLGGEGGQAQGKRLALVIGNASYDSSPLKNPVNDATDVAAALRRLGFEVVLGTNWAKREMEEAIRVFGERLRAGGVGLFYYAGHGMQVGGRNYLIPVGCRIETESDVAYEAVDAGRVLGKMEDAGNGFNIVVLDACRNNPFARSFRSAEQGLAQVTAPAGSFVAYATAPGSVAADGAGRNAPYTAALLEALAVPGLKVEDVFKRVRQTVARETAQKQVPWDSSSLVGDFYFVGSGAKKAAGGRPAPLTVDLVAVTPEGEHKTERPFGDAPLRVVAGRIIRAPIGNVNLVMPPGLGHIMIFIGPGFDRPSGYHVAEVEIVGGTATAVTVTRPGGFNNVTTPAWQMQAFDARGEQVGATIGEGDVSRGGYLYAATPTDFTISAAGIRRLRIASNNTSSTFSAVPFARFAVTVAPAE